MAATAVAKLFAVQSFGLAASAVAVEALPVTFPVRLPLNVVAVIAPSTVRLVTKLPLVLLRSIFTLAAPRSAPALCRFVARRLPAISAVARSIALVVLPEPMKILAVSVSETSASVMLAHVKFPLAAMALANWLALQSLGLAANAVAVAAKSIIMEFGISASVKAIHDRSPLAAIVVANWLEEQSLGLAAKAEAVDAFPVTLPVRLPLKVAAVIVPSIVKLVTKLPFVLLRSMLTLAAPRSVAALCKLVARRLPATSAVAKSIAFVLLPEPIKMLEVRVSETYASVKAVPFHAPAVIVPEETARPLIVPLVVIPLVVTSKYEVPPALFWIPNRVPPMGVELSRIRTAPSVLVRLMTTLLPLGSLP